MEGLGSFYYHKVLPAVQIIKQSQELFGEIALCYNGGKDCTVLLELIERSGLDIPIIAFNEPNTFKELIKFTQERLQSSSLRYQILPEDIKTEMGYLVKSGLKGIILGERIDDPGNPTCYYQKSSPGWGDYWRVYPIYNWSYSDIWFFLEHTQSKYCDLYRRGYTSIGSESKTRTNPSLSGHHAKYLFNPYQERLGRI